MRLQEFEVGALDVARMAHLAGTRITGGASSSLPSAFMTIFGSSDCTPSSCFEEVDVEVRAAKLTVGDRLEPHFLLHADRLRAIAAILDRAQFRGADLLAAQTARAPRAGSAAAESCRHDRRETESVDSHILLNQ